MASGFQENLSDAAIPSTISTPSSNRGRGVVPQANVTAQAIGAVAGLIGPITKLIGDEADKSATKGIVEKLSEFQAALDQGESPGAISVKRNSYIRELQVANPEKLDLIQKTVVGVLGTNPAQVQSTAQTEQVVSMEMLGRETYGTETTNDDGIPYTREDYIAKGYNTTRELKAMEARIKQSNLNADQKKSNTSTTIDDAVGTATLIGNDAVSSWVGSFAQLSSSVGSAAEQEVVTGFMDRGTNVINDWASKSIEVFTSRLYSGHPAYANVDKAAVLEGMTRTIHQQRDAFKAQMNDAKENGYLAKLMERTKLFETEAKMTAQESMRFVSAITAALGERVSAPFFTLEVVKSLGGTVKKELFGLVNAFKAKQGTGPSLEGGRAALALSLQHRIDLSTGKTKALDMNTPEERKEAVAHQAAVYKSFNSGSDDVDVQRDIDKYKEMNGTVVNAMRDLVVTAAHPKVTTLNTVRQLTKVLDANFVKNLSIVGRRAGPDAEQIGDVATMALAKEHSLELVELNGKIVFNKNTGRYESNGVREAAIKKLAETREDLISEGGAVSRGFFRNNMKRAEDEEMGDFNISLDNLNANLEKQWLFRSFSPAMSKANTKHLWFEAVNAFNVLNRVPLKAGQKETPGVVKLMQDEEVARIKGVADEFTRAASTTSGLISKAEKGLTDKSIFTKDVTDSEEGVTRGVARIRYRSR